MKSSQLTPTSTAIASYTTDGQAFEGKQQTLTTNMVNSQPASIQTAVTKIAPRPPGMIHPYISATVANGKLGYRKQSTTADDHTLTGEQQIITTIKANPSPPPIPLKTVIPHSDMNSIAPLIKSEPIDIETFDGGGYIDLPYTTLAPLSSVNDNMAATLLQTNLDIVTPSLTTSTITATTAIGTPTNANVTGLESTGISQPGKSSTTTVPHFDFLQTREEMTHAGLSTLEHADQQSPHATTHFATSTTTIQGNDLSGMTMTQLQQHPLLMAEILRKELNHQKIRDDNRERKKRWRKQNEEKNKDNDLRCRVNKRAVSLFGKEDSQQKQQWINEEFVKRQYRRRNKERSRTVINDAVSSTSATTHTHSTLPTLTKNNKPPTFASHSSSGQLPILQDACVSVLFNKIGPLPPDVERKLVEEMQLLETAIKQPGMDTEHVLQQQVTDFLHRLQQIQSPSPVDLPGNISTLTASSSPIISATSVSKSESSTPLSVSPVCQSMKTSNDLSPGSNLPSEIDNTSLPTLAPSSPLQQTHPATTETETETVISLPHSPLSNTKSMGSEQLVQLLSYIQKANPITNSSATKSYENQNGIIPTSTTGHFSNEPLDKNLSTLLINTLQQSALIYQEKLENVPAPLPSLLLSFSPSSTGTVAVPPKKTECDPHHATQQQLQLYPLHAIKTLTKINTEWAKQ